MFCFDSFTWFIYIQPPVNKISLIKKSYQNIFSQNWYIIYFLKERNSWLFFYSLKWIQFFIKTIIKRLLIIQTFWEKKKYFILFVEMVKRLKMIWEKWPDQRSLSVSLDKNKFKSRTKMSFSICFKLEFSFHFIVYYLFFLLSIKSQLNG